MSTETPTVPAPSAPIQVTTVPHYADSVVTLEISLGEVSITMHDGHVHLAGALEGVVPAEVDHDQRIAVIPRAWPISEEIAAEIAKVEALAEADGSIRYHFARYDLSEADHMQICQALTWAVRGMHAGAEIAQIAAAIGIAYTSEELQALLLKSSRVDTEWRVLYTEAAVSQYTLQRASLAARASGAQA